MLSVILSLSLKSIIKSSQSLQKILLSRSHFLRMRAWATVILFFFCACLKLKVQSMRRNCKKSSPSARHSLVHSVFSFFLAVFRKNYLIFLSHAHKSLFILLLFTLHYTTTGSSLFKHLYIYYLLILRF